MADPRIIAVELDEKTIIWRNADVEQERRVAIFDLLEENRFAPLRAYPHNGAAELLVARLEGKIDIDFDTARRLFTLICVLHMRG